MFSGDPDEFGEIKSYHEEINNLSSKQVAQVGEMGVKVGSPLAIVGIVSTVMGWELLARAFVMQHPFGTLATAAGVGAGLGGGIMYAIQHHHHHKEKKKQRGE